MQVESMFETSVPAWRMGGGRLSGKIITGGVSGVRRRGPFVLSRFLTV